MLDQSLCLYLTEFQKRVLFLLTDIRNELRQQRTQTRMETEETIADCKQIATLDELEEMEEELKNEEKRNLLVS